MKATFLDVSEDGSFTAEVKVELDFGDQGSTLSITIEDARLLGGFLSKL